MVISSSNLRKQSKADLVDIISSLISGCIWTAYDTSELEQIADELQNLYKLPKRVLVTTALELSFSEGPVKIAVYSDSEYPICLEEGKTKAKWITMEGNYIIK